MTLAKSYKQAIFPRTPRLTSNDVVWMEVVHALLSGKSVSISVVGGAYDGVEGGERFSVEYFDVPEAEMFLHADETIVTEYTTKENCSIFTLSALMSHRDTERALDAGFPIYLVSSKANERIVISQILFICAIADNS